VFPAGQLYQSADAIRALASGALDMSIQASPTLSQFEPNLSVITLPMFFGASRDDVRAVLDGPLGDELWGMVAKKGIVVPDGGHFEFAPNNSAYTTDKVVESYDDLTGVKLATPPSPVVVSILSEMGANPVATPRTEIVLQLTQGQIDGLGSVTDLTISGGKLWEAGIANAFADNAGGGVYIPLVSARTLDGLSEEQRQIIQDSWSEVVGWARDHSAAELETARATNEENGITYHDPSPEAVAAMRERMVGLQDTIVGDSGMDADFVGRVQAEVLGE
jgi:TRAP-type C4-dicarboxylate transport system substrate-binding protein